MTRLNVLQPSRSKLKPVLLQAYRLAVLVLIVLIIRQHHARLRIDGDAPIRLEEARQFWPEAADMVADAGPRQGLFVQDGEGNELGYLIRTAPQANHIIGYCGPTDTLIAFTPDMKVLDWKIRSSRDTNEHVQDVDRDRYFGKIWRKYTWDDLTTIDLREEGIEGVSGATLTSMAVADGIAHRVKWAADAAVAAPLRWTWIDVSIAAVLVGALAMAFTPLRGKPMARRAFQVVVIGFIGLYAGALMAQSLLAGWAMSGIAWRTAPGLALLAGAALLIPWATRRQIYCSHLCPHGAAQEWIGRVWRWKVRVPGSVARSLKLLPGALLLLVIVAVMLDLPLDLAGIEPFDAYLLSAAGWATISVAIIGLIASAFVPQAYCKFGCPTGALLNFVRGHGQADHFNRRDAFAALLVAVTAFMWWQHELLWSWVAPAAANAAAPLGFQG